MQIYKYSYNCLIHTLYVSVLINVLITNNVHYVTRGLCGLPSTRPILAKLVRKFLEFFIAHAKTRNYSHPSIYIYIYIYRVNNVVLPTVDNVVLLKFISPFNRRCHPSFLKSFKFVFLSACQKERNMTVFSRRMTYLV